MHLDRKHVDVGLHLIAHSGAAYQSGCIFLGGEDDAFLALHVCEGLLYGLCVFLLIGVVVWVTTIFSFFAAMQKMKK